MNPHAPIDAARKLVYVINVPTFFLSHRADIARAAQDAGWTVALIAGREPDPAQAAAARARLTAWRIDWRPARFTAAGRNPLRELLGLCSVIAQVRRLRPDVVHTASPKGNLYGGIAARLCRVPKLVVAVSGQGYLFTGRANAGKRLLQRLYLGLIRWVYAHPDCTVIVQNQDDHDSLLQQKLLQASQLCLVPGSGVDLQHFAESPYAEAGCEVLLPARLLADKGVYEFVAAARALRARHADWRFVLAGAADAANPARISRQQVEDWVGQGLVDWLGHQADIRPALRRAGIVCLPSYREGMPKALLEAAAIGRPVVCTDVVGCREAILPGQTGELVPVRDADALADTLSRLIDDPARRAAYAYAAREWAERRFDVRQVVAAHLRIYQAAWHASVSQ